MPCIVGSLFLRACCSLKLNVQLNREQKWQGCGRVFWSYSKIYNAFTALEAETLKTKV